MQLLRALRSQLRNIPVLRFNRSCFIAAEIWLAVTVPLGIVLRPTIHDFGQFYIGGAIVRYGEWHALYPVPTRGSRDNAGLRTHSFAKPSWLALSRARGVSDFTHFILPPPSALPFVPFSFLTYAQAFWFWIFILTACVIGVAHCAALSMREILGRPSRKEGVLAVLIALSPMTARAIRIGNVSPLIALFFGISVLALIRNKPWSGAVAVFSGSMLKYATLVIVPLLVSMRRWSMLLATALLGAIAIGATLLIAGKRPFLEFYQWILPTLSRPSAYPGNQTFPGLLARLFGRPLPLNISLLLDTARIVSFGCVLAVLPWTRTTQWRYPVNVMAAIGLLISWLLIFSPIAWEHWPIFLCPVWGWLLWEAKDPGPRRTVALWSLALMYFPAGILQVRGIATYRVILPEPVNSSQLIGVMLLFSLSFWRLVQARQSREPSSEQEVPHVRQLNLEKEQQVA